MVHHHIPLPLPHAQSFLNRSSQPNSSLRLSLQQSYLETCKLQASQGQMKERFSQFEPMRLLQVCPYPVLPAKTGGKIRIVKLARELSNLGVDVTILTPYHPRQAKKMIEREPFNVVQVPYPFILPLLFTDKPFPYQYLTSFHPGLDWLMRKHIERADIVQFEHAQFGWLASLLPANKLVVYDAHNVEYDYARSECQSRWSAELVGRRISKLEQVLVSRSSHIIATTLEDCHRFTELYKGDQSFMSIAPNGIDELMISRTDDRRALARFPDLMHYTKRGLYSGSNVMHNRVAVKFLLSEVATVRPDIAFVIQGSCGHSFERTCKLRNVFFDPEEKHFEDYTSGFFGLNTVTGGGGSNLKLLQYLRYGMPVVSTAFGMRGYEELFAFVNVCEPEHLWEALDDVLQPPVPNDVLACYQWSNIATGMLNQYHSLLDA